MAGATAASLAEQEDSQKRALQLRLQELHAKEEQLRRLERERQEKEVILALLSKQHGLLLDHVSEVSTQRQGEVQELEQELFRLRSENSSLIQRLETQEKRHRDVYARIQDKMQLLRDGQDEKDEEVKFWKEVSGSQGSSSTEAAELLRAQAEQICALKAQLVIVLEKMTEKRDKGENVGGSLKLAEQEVEHLKKQFFFALAVGLKLVLMHRGKECNVSTVSLWEECVREKVGFVSWRLWILEKLHKSSK